MRGEGGFALVLTLIVTALLVALCAEFVSEVYVETSLARNFVDGQQASLLAASGVDGGIALVRLTVTTQSYTTLADRWAKPLQLEDERGALSVTIQEESAKLNLNKILPPSGTLDPSSFYYLSAVNLVKKRGLSPDLVEALVDWLDGNDTPQPGGAESAHYATLKPPYVAKNAPLDTVEELGLVKGFTADLVAGLRPFVTIFGDDPNLVAQAPVNINTAPKEVLASLQYGNARITDDMADRIIDYRKTTPFKSPSALGSVPGIDPSVATGLAGYVSSAGKVFRIRSEARVREATRLVEAVVRFVGSQQKVIYWREYTP